SLLPSVITILDSLNLHDGIMTDVDAGQLVYGISGTIHTKSFEKMSMKKKKACLKEYINLVLGGRS
ncbi:MAG: hypothetical protein J6W48_02235, partial [Lachnospiraceae bacterium]|nr:hypothetical protein [Lachnospiraceae bacterium]